MGKDEKELVKNLIFGMQCSIFRRKAFRFRKRIFPARRGFAHEDVFSPVVLSVLYYGRRAVRRLRPRRATAPDRAPARRTARRAYARRSGYYRRTYSKARRKQKRRRARLLRANAARAGRVGRRRPLRRKSRSRRVRRPRRLSGRRHCAEYRALWRAGRRRIKKLSRRGPK